MANIKNWAGNTCIRVAHSSKYEKWQHGAIIELGGRIIASGTNSMKPLAPQDAKYSEHAEAAAIRKARWKGGTLYVARVNRHGAVKNSKPCLDCIELIRASRINRVCYSIGPNEWGIINIIR